MCIWLVCVSLIVGGGQERPFMGVSTIEFPREIKSDGQTFNHGIRINTVTPMTGADEAGLLAGDIIVEMDEIDFECETKELLSRFRETILAHKPGDTIKMKIFRDGRATRSRFGLYPFGAVDNPPICGSNWAWTKGAQSPQLLLGQGVNVRGQSTNWRMVL